MTHNDLAAIPEEYTKKKEEQLAKNTVKRMSARQRQINKVRSQCYMYIQKMWLGGQTESFQNVGG